MPPSRFKFRLLIALVAVVGCRPSGSKSPAQMQAEIERLAAEQEQLQDQVETLEAQNLELARDRDQASIERQRVRGATDDLVVRIAELEGKKVAEVDPPPRPPKIQRPDPAIRHRVDLNDAHTRGRADAKVTVVMFLDFQCPFCKRSQDTMRQIEKKYGRDVRLVFKHLPLAFHKQAQAAAMVAEAAGKQDKFWKMSKLLFENARDLDDKKFDRLAKKLKLDRKRMRRDRNNATLERKVKADQAQAAALGVRGTPGFFVNGMFLSGAQPLEAFSKVIDKELGIADERIKGGVAAREYYRTLMGEAQPPSG